MTVLAQRDGVRVAAFNKCGGTSIINTFMSRRNENPDFPNSNDRARAIGGYQGDLTNSQDWPEPRVLVAFMRDPARRALSAYQHFLVRKERYKFKELGFEFGMSFPAFVDHLLTVNLSADKHISPCVPDLLAAGGDCHYIVAPLEFINEAWPLIMDGVGLVDVPDIIAWHNKGSYNPDDFMTAELREKLRELYLQDFNLWCATYHEHKTRAKIPAVGNEIS